MNAKLLPLGLSLFVVAVIGTSTCLMASILWIATGEYPPLWGWLALVAAAGAAGAIGALAARVGDAAHE